MNYVEDNRNLRCVINPLVAKKLCDLGYPIVKIKSKRGTEGKENIFLFEVKDDFEKEFNQLIRKNKENI